MSKRITVVLALGAILALVIGWQIAALAGPVGTASGFEDDDGNLADDTTAGIDWNTFAPTTWTGVANLRTATDSADGWTFKGIEDRQATTTDSAFAGGTKQDDECASVIGAKAPNKDDLKRIYLAHKTVEINGVDHVFLNLAWVRIPQNTTSPSAHIGFEFNKAEFGGEDSCNEPGGLVQRTAGDMLIVYDFEGGSGDLPRLTLRRWVTDASENCEVQTNEPPCWGTATDLTAGGFAEGRVNTSAVGTVLDQVADPDETLGLNEFGEAGIDLTAAGVFDAGSCESFGTAFGVSRSSGNSAQAQMKDLVGPTDFELKNCGQVIIRKETHPDEDPNTTQFDYTTTGGLDPATFNLTDDESQDYGPEVLAGNYSVTEADPGPKYALTSIDCSASETDDGTTIDTTTTPLTVSFNLAPEDTVDCTFHNTRQLGALKILKNSTKTGTAVTNAGAVFSYDGQSVTDNGAGDEDSDVGEVCVSGLDIGDYTVDDTSPPSGYGDASERPQNVTVVTGTNCTDNQPTGTGVVTFTNPPLADIQVNFRDGGSGETALEDPPGIVCNNTTGTTDDTTPATGWDVSETVTGIEAGASTVTVTCTIPIDP